MLYRPRKFSSPFTVGLSYTSKTTQFPIKHSIRQLSTTNSHKSAEAVLERLKLVSGGDFPTTSAAIVLVFGGAMAARWWYTSNVTDSSILLDPTTGAPRQDQSMVTIVMPAASKGILGGNEPLKFTSTRQSQENVVLDEGNDEEETSLAVQVDREVLRLFLQAQRQILQVKKGKAQDQTQQILHEQLSESFSNCQTRGVQQFAKWYFSYTTTYRLLSIALKSAAKHAVTFRKEQTLQELVTQDLQHYIMEKYQAMVLRPAVTDPKVHRAAVKALEMAHVQIYQAALLDLEEAMREFADQHHATINPGSSPSQSSSSAKPLSLPADSVRIRLDWRAQLQKAQHLPIAYEKRPPEFSVALIGGGALTGKLAGGAAIKTVSAKLAAPFVTKAVGSTLGSKVAAAGLAGGALAGGPVGAGVGAAIGITLDMAVNQGISLMQRSAFEEDVQQALKVTLLEWEGRILPEINRVVQEEWFGQLEGMLRDNVK